jgi:hypothetical protein
MAGLETRRTVENPRQVVEIGGRPILAFITIGGPQAHVDRRRRLPHL